MSNIFYIDGEFVMSDDAMVPADDLAILRGYGIFELTRTYGGKAFRLDAHLERLQRSADSISLDLPLSLAEIQRISEETLARNGHDESIIRIVVTGGTSPDNITPDGSSRLLVLVKPVEAKPAGWYSEGVKIITNHEERYLPQAKTINYIPAIIALKKAQAQGAVEAIYVDKAGHALEGTTTNIFAFFGDQLVTPGSGVLLGITRKTILEVASADYEVSLRDLPLDELLTADEVFIASSTKEICPVRQVDDRRIGAGKPGPRTMRILEMFRTYAIEQARA